MELTTAREKSLFNICVVLASVFWLSLVVLTVGLGLLYLAAAFVFYLFVHSALIAHLKGDAVLITSEQFPDLHLKVLSACEKLKMNIPKVYLRNGNGVLNAFATKFLRNYYVVLLTDVVDAFEAEPGSIDFYIGHELGHIHRNHLRWWPVFAPLNLLPLLMPAYRRACESTCDRYGRFCCDSEENAVRGLALLAAGNKLWKSLSPSAYAAQTKESGGLWMSFHELTGSYPWLSKRMAMLMGGEAAKSGFPKRHPLAWALSFFCPGFLTGGLFPILMAYVIGISLAVAVPSFMKYQEKAKAKQSESQSAAPEKAGAASQWKNPVSGLTLDLPEGFRVIPASGKNEMLVGSFSNDPDNLLEQLLVESAAKKIDFDVYVTALHKAKASLIGPALPLTKPKFMKVGDQRIAEFSFEQTLENVKYTNMIRTWTHDNLHFWHVISTIRADSDAAHSDSEKFLAFLVSGTR